MKELILATLIGSVLVGCGGSDDSNGDNGGTTPLTSDTPAIPDGSTVGLGGTVIDGYVQGATVFLDRDFNGVLSGDEPHAVTDSSGQYVLQVVPEDPCLGAAPIIVDVPVGAVDSTTGVVTSAYKMLTPPSSFDGYTGRDSNTTPFTTMVWTEVQKQAILEGVELTCGALIGVESETSDWLLDTTGKAEKQVAENIETNISVIEAVSTDNLYQDFIKEGRGDLEIVAQEEVATLQETEKAKSENPDSQALVRVLSELEYDSYGIVEDGLYVSTMSFHDSVNGAVVVLEEVEDQNDQVLYYLQRTLVDTAKWNYVAERVSQVGLKVCTESSYVVSVSNEESIKTNRIFNNVDFNDEIDKCPLTPDAVEQIVSSVFDDTQSNVHANSGNEDIVRSGFTETELEYPNEELPLWSATPSSNNFYQDIDELFVQLESVMSGNESFDQTPSIHDGQSGWKKVFRYEEGTFNKTHYLIERDSDGFWRKTSIANDGYQIPENFCLRPAVFEEIVGFVPTDGASHDYRVDNGKYYDFISVLDGDLFEQNGDPLDYWLNTGDRGGDAIWSKIPSDYQPSDDFLSPCDIRYDAWSMRGIYFEQSGGYKLKSQ
ncbi:hypothetical protein R7040_10360 [Vibrio sp. 1069]|uniref:hypothetical protein n=1 Tax=Vibrio TaxID=662 RepID=UPI0021D0E830|nr:hypothetical protein [Vibrio sp. 1069]MDW2331503.1 hypothetical protein [Vibrio sp. 1069]